MNTLANLPSNDETALAADPVQPDAGAPKATLRGRTKWLAAGGLALAAMVLAGAVALAVVPTDNASVPSVALPAAAGTTTGVDAAVAARLIYLVEEEKLAHDIYVLSESLYGTRIFSNISRSETQHQESIRGLLATYGLDDPSVNAAPGVFTDPALQDLYNTLAVRVNQSEAEAIQAGVLIEQTDIADLKKALEANAPTDVTTVLTQLEAASQNHLQAFLRNAGRA